MKRIIPPAESRKPAAPPSGAVLARIHALLRSQSTQVLATVCQNGTPHSTPLFFLADDDLRLYWFSSRKSLHSRNCARDPSASVSVFRETSRWCEIQGVQMRGSISMVRDRARRRAIVPEYCARFGLDARFKAVLRLTSLYCFAPEWVRLVENERKFGEKIEIEFHPGSRPA